jgi:cell fate regulator YaaT (PSP1 superfamily)
VSTTPDASLVAVKLKPVGRVQYAVAEHRRGASAPRVGDHVVVQTPHGSAVGRVVPSNAAIAERHRPAGEPVNRVIRMASHDDVVARMKQEHREREAYRVALLKIRERGLSMKLTRVEQAFDGSRLVFYFTAESRVDFRELVRELAGEFRTRIEMRQVGVRD